MRDDAGYWHRTDDSGQDVKSIEQDWQSERDRITRDFSGKTMLHEVLCEASDEILDSLAALAREGNDSGVGLMVCAMVRKWIEDGADRSIFGRVLKRNF